MKYPERVAIVENLPYESRLGYMAFCVERCFKEARRHPVAREQLERLPLLTEGLEMLWARAEQGVLADPEQIKEILAHVSTYEKPAPDLDNVLYIADVTLVKAARMLMKAMKVLEDPEAKPRYVAGALEGAVQSVGGIYADAADARDAEVAVIDTALEKLRDWRNKPFTRYVFEGIPDWTRGELSKKYAEGRIKGTDSDDED